MRKDILEKSEMIHKWVAEKMTKAQMCKELKCRPTTLNMYLAKLGIVYSGNKAGGLHAGGYAYIPYEAYIQKGGHKTDQIKAKLLRDGLIQYRCNRCGISTWLGERIALELHHKDGNIYNVSLENLELLCPNCHSQTDTYRRRKPTNPPTIYRCSCGNIVSRKGLHCKKCAIALRYKEVRAHHPSKEQLYKDLLDTPNFLAIGKKYNVTDNAIRKWCRNYGLPTSTKEWKQIPR